MKTPANSLADAAAKTTAAARLAITADKSLKQSKARYKTAKKALKHTRKAAKKFAKAARKAQRKLEKLQKLAARVAKTKKAAARKKRAGTKARPPKRKPVGKVAAEKTVSSSQASTSDSPRAA